MFRVAVHAAAPDLESIRRVASTLRDGGLAAIPTDTLYALAVNPFDPVAVNRLFAVKGRELDRALPLVAADAEQVRMSIGSWTPLAEQLAAVFWPGALTLVLTAPVSLPVAVTGGTGAIGVRVPAHIVARALCAATGVPLTATSANISGTPPTSEPDVVAAELGAHLDVLLDAGRTPGGPPSTIVDVRGEQPLLIRAGAIAWDAVLAAATRR